MTSLGLAIEEKRRLEERLGAFFAGLAPAVEVVIEAQKRLDLQAATRFSVFRYFMRTDEHFRLRETILSGIVADLLRPDGSHGQGAEFLRLFLKEVDRRGKKKDIRQVKDYGSLDSYAVWTEYSTPQKRSIDIVLKNENGDQWIGIENKPWAGEQADQLQDYLDFLRKQDEDACILYMSGRGVDSNTIELGSGGYLMIPYGYNTDGPSVAHWIDECYMHCQSDRVRWFLKELREYIQWMFHAETSAEE